MKKETEEKYYVCNFAESELKVADTLQDAVAYIEMVISDTDDLEAFKGECKRDDFILIKGRTLKINIEERKIFISVSE